MEQGRHRPGRKTDAPSPWLDALVTVVLLAYLGYAMVVLKEQGLPFATIIGGLLGGYLGKNYLRRRGQSDDDDPPAGGKT